MLNLLHFDDLSLLQDFDGIEALIVFRLDQVDSPKRAGAQRSLDRKVCQGIFSFGLSQCSFTIHLAARGGGTDVGLTHVGIAVAFGGLGAWVGGGG